MIKPRRIERTGIYSSDFEAFASEVAADVWNKLVEVPQFYFLKPQDYPTLLELITGVLRPYRRFQLRR